MVSLPPILGGCDVTVGRNQELTPRFSHDQAEARWTQAWGDQALPDAIRRFGFSLPGHRPKPWFLPMPPPNITGQLHLGHALFLTLQDIQTRYRALRGDDALWLPGTDHAGLATHAKILETMAQEGTDPADASAYWDTGWEWKQRYHQRITGQMRRMGASCDWTQERFTLDEAYLASAKEAFSRLWRDGLIYRQEGQWWMDMEPLAQPLREALASGELSIHPLRSARRLEHFLENLEPWCLSRQIRWGMTMPLKEQDDGTWLLDEGENTPGRPSEDTLDTWFLSSLWPFASLGWPHNTAALERYYPGDWIETGEDILFFWCARMWMMGNRLTGQWPFKRIFLHGIIRDKDNEKMSKSLGNGIDPLEIIDAFGTDALRWHLAFRAEPAKDMRFNPQALQQDAAWLNKIWQAGRFLAQFGSAPKTLDPEPADLLELRQALNEDLEADRYPAACRRLQQAFREGFCGTWIEQNKAALREGNTGLLNEGWSRFAALLSMIHPFLPFLTSELHLQLGLPTAKA